MPSALLLHGVFGPLADHFVATSALIDADLAKKLKSTTTFHFLVEKTETYHFRKMCANGSRSYRYLDLTPVVFGAVDN